MTRALSAACVSFVDGIPILTLSIGETCSELRGTFTVSTGVFEESIFIPDMPDESVFMLDMLDESVDIIEFVVVALSPC